MRRCVAQLGGSGAYKSGACGGACVPLAAGEWLAHDCCGLWRSEPGVLIARKQTWLKKTTAGSADLPPSQKLAVAAGTRCRVGNSTRVFGDYVLCALPGPR